MDTEGMKTGIHFEIPGFNTFTVRRIVTDYTGTLSCDGVLVDGVADALRELAERVSVIVLTSDTTKTAARQLAGLPIQLSFVPQEKEADEYKEEFLRLLGGPLSEIAVFGNGRNDRNMLEVVKWSSGLSVAVDAGEGVAAEALEAANLFAPRGPLQALGFLLKPNRAIATLRTR